jgi:HD superfamily phosphodiesterase
MNLKSLKNKVEKLYCKLSKNKWLRVKRVLAFATLVGRKMKLSKKDIRIIQLAALLHDIGYIKQFQVGGKDRHEEYSCEVAKRVT